MTPRAKKRPRYAHVRWRGNIAYYERDHTRLEGGRIYRSLGTTEPALAAQYAQALTTLMERGDWHAVERWRNGEIHISDLARIVRDGDYAELRRLASESIRLGEAVERFLQRSEATRKAKTTETYASALGLLLEHFGADYPMSTLTTKEAEEFLHAEKATTAGQVWSANTQSAARTVYKALWRMVIRQEAEAAHIADSLPAVVLNPWVDARVPERRQTRHGFLTPEQWRALITHEDVVDTREAAFLGCACLAGLRQMEICYLRTGVDVDMDMRVIHVQDRKGDEAWTTKTANGQRDIEMVQELYDLLLRHCELGYVGERYLFRQVGADRPLNHTAALEWTRRAFTAAGIRYGRQRDALTLHSLRHTFGTWMAQDGVPFHVVAELMGNTAAVVLRTYAHFAPHDLAKAMESIRRRTAP